MDLKYQLWIQVRNTAYSYIQNKRHVTEDIVFYSENFWSNAKSNGRRRHVIVASFYHDDEYIEVVAKENWNDKERARF